LYRIARLLSITVKTGLCSIDERYMRFVASRSAISSTRDSLSQGYEVGEGYQYFRTPFLDFRIQQEGASDDG
jgi:hypothetical protein